MAAIGERIISTLKKAGYMCYMAAAVIKEMLQVPMQCDIHVDDYVFLRPTQSETLIPQFYQLYVYVEGKFLQWQTFRE
jgi:D-serine deaminase-like pyridoxal phosphate-dependent protein